MRGGRDREHRIGELIYEIGALMAVGHMARAVPLQREALDMARELLTEQPGEPRYIQGLASLLYGMGSTLTATGLAVEAVDLLNECEQLYARLPETGAYRADVCARRGMAQSARGFGASAVLELDDAADRYIQLGAGAAVSPHYLDLARVLALSAIVQHRHSDADMAVSAADQALRMYLSRAAEVNAALGGAARTPYFIFAAEVASEVHFAHGRLDLTKAADEMAVHATSGVGDKARHAAALARQSLHLGDSPDANHILEQAGRIDQHSADEALTRAAAPRPITFAEALDQGAPATDGLRELLIDPRGGEMVPLPSGRCQGHAGLALLNAVQLSGHAHSQLESAPEAGRRLGLEAHFLFAIASRGGEHNLRHRFGDLGPIWAGVVLATARSFAQSGDPDMEQDLRGWLRGIVLQLSPFALMNQAVAAVIAECDPYLS